MMTGPHFCDELGNENGIEFCNNPRFQADLYYLLAMDGFKIDLSGVGVTMQNPVNKSLSTFYVPTTADLVAGGDTNV